MSIEINLEIVIFRLQAKYNSHFADEALNKNLIENQLPNLEKFLETKYLVTGTILISSPMSAETIFSFR